MRTEVHKTSPFSIYFRHFSIISKGSFSSVSNLKWGCHSSAPWWAAATALTEKPKWKQRYDDGKASIIREKRVIVKENFISWAAEMKTRQLNTVEYKQTLKCTVLKCE